jgi:epoxyqueuosine reductase
VGIHVDSMTDTKAIIREKAKDAGFDTVGFARAEAGPDDKANLARFLDGGRHGDMDWMARTRERRADPRVLWPEARTIIALGLSYAPAVDPLARLDHPDQGAVSVYARGRDYHDVLKKRLKTLARWLADTHACEVKVFVDTAPVMEKPAAQRAGLGWQGKHTNLVSRTFGSWLFLGEVLTTLDLDTDPVHADMCGSCDACQRACPTDALPVAYEIEATRCISYLTIEHEGDIPESLRTMMGNRIYGCDDCLAACPWNKFAAPAHEPAFAPRIELSAPLLKDLADLDDVAFCKVFAGSPIKRTGRDRFLRNVLIAVGNSGDAAFADQVTRLADDPAPVVRNAANWALGRLGQVSVSTD